MFSTIDFTSFIKLKPVPYYFLLVNHSKKYS